MSERLAYLILGSRGGGRFDVVADLVDFGVPEDQSVQVFVSESDASAWGKALPIRHPNCEQRRYEWKGLDVGLSFDASKEVVFIVADGMGDPADFVEAFFYWLKKMDYDLGRIVTVADCARICGEKQLLLWYDCCIHFSDVVLLNNRTDVPNKWIDGFKDRYLKQYYPCLFELVKKGRLANPSLILEPQARRISKLFDDPEEFEFLEEAFETEVEIEDEDGQAGSDEDDEEPFDGGDPDKDPFLARMVNGRREKTLPDIARLLG